MKHCLSCVTLMLGLWMPVHAGLLTDTGKLQLESWLGQGDLEFTNVFTKVKGDQQNGLNFLDATTGAGPTFLLMEVYGSSTGSERPLPVQVIGGYNPNCWDGNGYYLTPNDCDRSAFIFNLTFCDVRDQGLSSDSSFGEYQTRSGGSSSVGFGLSDLATNFGRLEEGYAHPASYGGTLDPITHGPSQGDRDPNYDSFLISRIEVYSFARVPDAGITALLLMLSTLGMIRFARKAG